VKGLSQLRLGSEFGRSESKGGSRPREGERERVRQRGRGRPYREAKGARNEKYKGNERC